MQLPAASSFLADEQLLIRELNHRINNEFAAVMTMLSLAAARTTNVEAKAALEAATDRLGSYARVHQAL
jgi:two-component sensor histidine kinase